MQFIYIVGAQCTGKTTLVEALSARVADNAPELKCETVRETARTTLQLHGFTKVDVRSGGERCLQLQRLVMQSQMERERVLEQQELDLVISDRSGIDPLVYAQIYCNKDAVDEMQESETWKDLRSSLRRGVVIVCEPVQQWLNDDGTRLMPLDWKEWRTTHESFCMLLSQHTIQYVVLHATMLSIRDRVDFVLAHCGFKPEVEPVTQQNLSDEHRQSGERDQEEQSPRSGIRESARSG